MRDGDNDQFPFGDSADNPSEKNPANDGSSSDAPEEVPASVIFMEMMRQVAAKSTPKPTPESAPKLGDKLPRPKPRPKRPETENTVTSSATSPNPVLSDDSAAKSLPAMPAIPKFELADIPPELPVSLSPEPPVIPLIFDPIPEPGAEPAPDNSIEEVTAPVVPEIPAPAVDESPSEALPTQPLSPEERRRAAAMEAQRLRRVKRRQEKRRIRRVSVLGGVIRSFIVILPSAILIATILSWFTDPQFLKPETRASIQAAIIASGATPIPPTPIPTANYNRLIGIVSGHNGPGQNGIVYDPGAVCEDDPAMPYEQQINLSVATLVVRGLRERGYSVDLLDEFDPRLENYQSATLVSIHTNTCQDFGERVSGFLVAKAEARPEGGIDAQLAECIARHYGAVTSLDRRFGLTIDMTDYHSFREVHPTTPAAIIELGFMRADKQILVEKQDVMARGIINGILCFLEPQNDTLVPTTAPTATFVAGTEG